MQANLFAAQPKERGRRARFVEDRVEKGTRLSRVCYPDNTRRRIGLGDEIRWQARETRKCTDHRLGLGDGAETDE
jgi:hypothetical protein